MSQALLFNTAALQNNLTAAQRGDDTAAELRELNTGNARGTTQQSMAPPPSTPENAGAYASLLCYTFRNTCMCSRKVI